MSEMPWINPIIKDKDGPWVTYTDYAALESKFAAQAELITMVQAALTESDERVAELLGEVNLLKAALRVCADSDSILRRQEIKNKALGGGE
jgi:uncharacterized coiled-coil protein SlyX